MQPCSITINGKTIKFNNSIELWNWCIRNKPEWVKLPNSNYMVGVDEADRTSCVGLDFATMVNNPDSYSSFGCVDE